MLDKDQKTRALAEVTGLDTSLPIEYHIKTLRQSPDLSAYELCRALGRESHLTAHHSLNGSYESYINIRADAPFKLAKAFKKNGFRYKFYDAVWQTIKLYSLHQAQGKKKNEPLLIKSNQKLHDLAGVNPDHAPKYYKALDKSGVAKVKTWRVYLGDGTYCLNAEIRFTNIGSNNKHISVPLPKSILDQVLSKTLLPAPMHTWLLIVSNVARFGYKSVYYFQLTTFRKGKVVKLKDSNEEFLRCMNIFVEDIKYLESIFLLTDFICNRLDEPKTKIHYVVLHGLREWDERLQLSNEQKARCYQNELEADECELTQKRIQNKKFERRTAKITHPENRIGNQDVTHPENGDCMAQNADIAGVSAVKNENKFTHPEMRIGGEAEIIAHNPGDTGLKGVSEGGKFTHPEMGHNVTMCNYSVPPERESTTVSNNNTVNTMCRKEKDNKKEDGTETANPSAPPFETTGFGSQSANDFERANKEKIKSQHQQEMSEIWQKLRAKGFKPSEIFKMSTQGVDVMRNSARG